MFYHEDWLMRQIESMVAVIVAFLFGKEIDMTELYENEASLSTFLNDKLQALLLLVRQGEICKAEDTLFEEMDTADREWLKVALRFYSELNKLSNKELEAHDFSREEIKEGIRSVCKRYKVDVPSVLFESDE